MSHFERIIRECAINIEYIINEYDKYRYVSNRRFTELQKRVALLEGPSPNLIQTQNINITDTPLNTEDGDSTEVISPEDVVVQIDDTSRNVLLKSPERANDDAWVHVDNIINDA